MSTEFPEQTLTQNFDKIIQILGAVVQEFPGSQRIDEADTLPILDNLGVVSYEFINAS